MNRATWAYAVAFGLADVAMGVVGCAALRSAAKDPIAAVAKVKADARVIRAEFAQACADLHAAEASGLVPAGKARDDADLLCELDAATR